MNNINASISAAKPTVRSASNPLRNAFRLNGTFSGLTGIIAATAAGPVADFFAVDQVWIIRALGVALLGFAAMLFFVATRPDSDLQLMAAPISAADIGWVVGTVVIIAFGWLSTAGAVTMGVIAVAVFGFALAQLRARAAMVNAMAKAI